MDKQNLLENLEKFRSRLLYDVASAYAQRGSDFGRERFKAWRREIDQFLDINLPGKKHGLDKKLSRSFYAIDVGESDFNEFMRFDGNPCLAFVDSLILDITNDEHMSGGNSITEQSIAEKNQKKEQNDRIFIVHGHNEALKITVARFIEKLGYKPVILHEQANQGKTIIEKIESHTNVGFAIVIYTEDDLGNSTNKANSGNLNNRARQNVVFEHGYLIAKLKRERVVPLVSGNIELPSDINGVVHTSDRNWQIDIAKEMRAVGYNVDFNKLIDI
ncbi:nucleotide-binding protein [Lysobacter hankyongensis]|uniref:Nucleotide-binding protein n=1 Tax=Lysobacter hankyongensis TaxID=1176535 RepID=A0ABP9BPV1_9GAMM